MPSRPPDVLLSDACSRGHKLVRFDDSLGSTTVCTEHAEGQPPSLLTCPLQAGDAGLSLSISFLRLNSGDISLIFADPSGFVPYTLRAARLSRILRPDTRIL